MSGINWSRDPMDPMDPMAPYKSPLDPVKNAIARAREYLMEANHNDPIVSRIWHECMRENIRGEDMLVMLAAGIHQAKTEVDRLLMQSAAGKVRPMIIVTSEEQRNALEQLLTKTEATGGTGGQG